VTLGGNGDGCENKGIAGKAIRKNMKTKGGQIWPQRHREHGVKTKKRPTPWGIWIDVKIGSPTTDYGVMQGEYWAARATQQGVFAHI